MSARLVRLLVALCLPVAVSALCASPVAAQFTYLPTAQFGSQGSGAGQFSGPLGVAVDEGTNDVYVADYENNRVEKFDASGKYLSELDGAETPQAGFDRPTGVAVDDSADAAKGRVYVADRAQGVIDAFDPTGKYLFQMTIQGLETIATDASGHLWVWTNQAAFEEYGESGSLILRQPIGRGTAPGLVVDTSGNVYVLYGSRKIGRYSPPEFIENNEAGVEGATALAIDPTTNKIFQDDGSSIVEWPAFGEGPGLWERTEETITGSLGYSEGLAVDGKDGTIYASDFSNNRVEVFERVVVPDVSTGAASEVTPSSATVAGTVNPDKTKAEYFIEWGESQSYGHSTPVESGEGEAPVPVSAELTGLEANTTYHYRVVASNENGTSRGSDETFTTSPLPPVLEGITSASNPTRSSIVLHATINPRHSDTAYHFIYAEEAAYDPAAVDPYGDGGATADVEMGALASGQAVEQLVSGLKPETTYHYELVAINQAGRVVGTDGTFTTGAATPPTATTGAAGDIAQNTATIAGSLDTSGLPTNYGFEIATSTDYGPPTGLGTVGAGLNGATVSLALSGLQPGTTYHYRLTATNVDGTSYGADHTFTTSVFASTFATPPAPLPFVETPTIAFPAEAHVTVSKKQVKKKSKRHVKKKRKKSKRQKKKK